jgi:hypothetical protein
VPPGFYRSIGSLRLEPHHPANTRRLSDTMTHLFMAGPGGVGTTARSRSLLVGAAAGTAIATLVNVALWAGGRAADASFLVILPTGDAMQVGIVEVVLKTVLAFAVGFGVLALAARRSHRVRRRLARPEGFEPPTC